MSDPSDALVPFLGDPQLFGNDAGEDESPEILASYFVDQPAFGSFFSRSGSFAVARSKKGMGKSALLSKLAFDIERESRDVVIQTTGPDLLGVHGHNSKDHSVLQAYWKQLICSQINAELGSRIGLAVDDSELSLVEVAELQGTRQRNLIGALLARLKGQIGSLEVKTAVPSDASALLERYQAAHSSSTIWLLVDDIDSTFVDTKALRARVSTFFSACRALARDVPGLKVRSSVRSDVWTTLRYNEDLDKCEQYIVDIRWSQSELRRILERRIQSFVDRRFSESAMAPTIKSSVQDSLHLVFEQKIRWGQALVDPFYPIKILSAGRPRWVAQLCRLAGRDAIRVGRSRIGISNINSVMRDYGRFRLNDIYKEYGHQFSDLERVVECFAGGKTRYQERQLLKHIEARYLSSRGHLPDLGGYKLTHPVELARFLFKVGFIMSRESEISGPGDFMSFEEAPELLSSAESRSSKRLWEIHPSYRTVLRIRN